jgi:lipoprotein-anchoring transpeptidase ErfK/SrfK
VGARGARHLRLLARVEELAAGGPVGIHGTNERSAIGHAASHGCIRLPNAMMKRLFAQVPAGTPIVIRA